MLPLRTLLALVGLAAALHSPASAQPTHFVQQWGTQGAEAGQFSYPFGIAWSPSGRVYVCDQFNFRVQYFTSSGEYLGSFAHADPYNIAVGPDGSVYLSSGVGVRRVTADGVFLQEWGGEQTPGGAWFSTVALAVESDGDVLVLHAATKQIYRFTADGQFLAQIEGSISQGGGASITVNAKNEIYVAGPHNGTTMTVVKFSEAGDSIGTITPPFPSNVPAALAVDELDNLYFVDFDLDHVLVFSPSGALIESWGTFGSAAGQLDRPSGIALDGAGRVFVLELGNHRVSVFGDETPATRSSWGRLKAAYRN